MRAARSARRRTAGGLLALALALALWGAPARGAAGQEQLPSDPLGQAPQAIVDASLAFERARAKVTDLAERLTDVQAKLTSGHAELRRLDDAVTRNRRAQSTARRTLRERAAEIYRARDPGLAVLSVDRALDLGTAAHYADAVAPIDGAEVARLSTEAAQLLQARQSQVATILATSERRDALSDELVNARRVVTDAETELQRVGGLSVMGPSTLTASEIAAWFRSTGQKARLDPSVTIDDVARLFVIEGDAEGVRGDVAFAQSIIETGSFGSAPNNNYAGIGWCDSCADGIHFDTPQDGVRAQIQLLRNYADAGARADRLEYAPSVALYGADPARAASLYDTFPFKGKAPLWNVMGGGNWATDPLYAGKVLGVYAKMLEHAAQHPRS